MVIHTRALRATARLRSLASAVITAAAVVAGSASTTVIVNTQTAVAVTGPCFAPAFGWEMWVWLNNYVQSMTDPVFIKAASQLSGSCLRLGGITADWVYYDVPGAGQDGDGPRGQLSGGEHAPLTHKPLKGFWPTSEQNVTAADITALLTFMNATGIRLILDLNELHGRNCNTTNPVTQQPDWCVGDWDTRNVQALLTWLAETGAYVAGGPLIGLELGNELVTHMDASNNTADILRLAELITHTWTGDAPPLYAPSTDDCYDAPQRDIMNNITGVPGVAGFSYHAYPGGSGEKPPLMTLLTNATWLRTGILTGSESEMCIQQWNNGPRASGLQLLITESSSSWNWQLPPPAQNSVLHGFFTLSELGQYAPLGVGMVARWAFAEPSPFATLYKNGSRWDAAADYFLLLTYKAVVGHTVLAVTGDEPSGALVYAHCTPYSNGSVTVMIVNPSSSPVALSVSDGSGGIAAAPRMEYVFTGPGGSVNSTTPVLNGNEAAPLRLGSDGSPPAMPGAYVPSGSSPSTLTLPPLSQSFMVLLAAGAPACM